MTPFRLVETGQQQTLQSLPSAFPVHWATAKVRYSHQSWGGSPPSSLPFPSTSPFAFVCPHQRSRRELLST